MGEKHVAGSDRHARLESDDHTPVVIAEVQLRLAVFAERTVRLNDRPQHDGLERTGGNADLLPTKDLDDDRIAGLLEVAKSRATVIIENLVKKGLVQRSQDPNDARVKLISLTPFGQRKVREIEEFMFTLHQQLLDHIDPIQRTGVITALETLRSSMEAVKSHLL